MRDAFVKCGTLFTAGPGKVLIGYGKRNWSAKPGGVSEPQFFFPDFFRTNAKQWFTHENYCEVSLEDLLKELSHKRFAPLSWQSANLHAFQVAFTDIQNRFRNGTLQKAVPYVFEKSNSPLTEASLTNALISLLSYATRHPVFVYGFWGDNEGMLGGTPEILFTLEQKIAPMLHTMACAGTCKKGQQADLNNSKEQDEHQLVIKDICETLRSWGILNIGNTTTIPHGQMLHLSTPISVELAYTPSFESAVDALHPTAALGAYPRKEGIEWLRYYQTINPRMRFGAPAGYRYKEESRCYVAIRNVQWNQYGSCIGAGCGVLPTSNYEMEWNEIQLKIKTIKNLLNL